MDQLTRIENTISFWSRSHSILSSCFMFFEYVDLSNLLVLSEKEISLFLLGNGFFSPNSSLWARRQLRKRRNKTHNQSPGKMHQICFQHISSEGHRITLGMNLTQSVYFPPRLMFFVVYVWKNITSNKRVVSVAKNCQYLILWSR